MMIATEERASANMCIKADFRLMLSLSPCMSITPVTMFTINPINATIIEIFRSMIWGFKNLSTASYSIQTIDKTIVIPFTKAANTSMR